MSHHEHHHDHHHGEDDSFYIDQLCMVALSGAFGAICLSLYFWQTRMLSLLLGSQFHPYVLASGIALITAAALRGYTLWVQVGQKKAHAQNHDHGHSHSHNHDHEHGHSHGHDHVHGEACDHDHGHDHAHSHDQLAHAHDHPPGHVPHHHHDHDASDHDHGWAPWRYVVLLVPILLFLLGIPNRLPPLKAEAHVDLESPAEVAGLLATGSDRWGQVGHLVRVDRTLFDVSDTSKAPEIPFVRLETAGATQGDRDYWGGKLVKVRGQFNPSSASKHVFGLVRFKISCCAADAVPLKVTMRCRDRVDDIKPDTWVEVSGRIQFLRQGASYFTVLNVASRKDVRECDPDPRTYVQ